MMMMTMRRKMRTRMKIKLKLKARSLRNPRMTYLSSAIRGRIWKMTLKTCSIKQIATARVVDQSIASILPRYLYFAELSRD
jgi:hypothetical protein